jgi:hypothetical protein
MSRKQILLVLAIVVTVFNVGISLQAQEQERMISNKPWIDPWSPQEPWIDPFPQPRIPEYPWSPHKPWFEPRIPEYPRKPWFETRIPEYPRKPWLEPFPLIYKTVVN